MGHLRRRFGGGVVRLRRGGGRLLVRAQLDPFALEPATREVVAGVDLVLATEELDTLTFK